MNNTKDRVTDDASNPMECLVMRLPFQIWHNSDGNKLLGVYLENGGKITILDRETGWGSSLGKNRDVETGYKDIDGMFWLASGMFDIRTFPKLTALEAIKKIKECANTVCGA